MRRRTFLIFSLLSFFTKLYASKKTNQLQIIKSVLEHLFPNTPTYSGASSFKGYDFFLFVMKHPTFNKDDLKFILEGANKLDQFNNQFIFLNTKTKEKILREFETLNFGQNWLSTLLYYGLEAMLGDPIYKGNKDMLGWKNINHTIPVPTASQPFGKKI